MVTFLETFKSPFLSATVLKNFFFVFSKFHGPQRVCCVQCRKISLRSFAGNIVNIFRLNGIFSFERPQHDFWL